MQETQEYELPSSIRDWLAEHGYQDSGTAMQPYIEQWDSLLKAQGEFWDYSERDTNGREYKQHRMTLHPARRVCNEWASLIMSEKTEVSTDSEECNKFLADFCAKNNFIGRAEESVSDAFALGTSAWALWCNFTFDYQDILHVDYRIRQYDARMIIPISWDSEGITECGFASQTVINGMKYDQLQLHRKLGDTYSIQTYLFDTKTGKQIENTLGILPYVDTGSTFPTFAVFRPAIPNRCVDFSPFGQSVLRDATDILKSVDMAYNAMFTEVDLGRMRIFMSDMMFDVEQGERRVPIPFGKTDATIYRKTFSPQGGEPITTFAPSLRVDAIGTALRLSLQQLGDSCGFGLNYFDIDKSGGVVTATQVSSENSVLMRSIRKHENVLNGVLSNFMRGVLAVARKYGEKLPVETCAKVTFDDSIIVDTQSEKAQDLAEINITMQPWEYRVKWYGESEEEAKSKVPLDLLEQDLDLSAAG